MSPANLERARLDLDLAESTESPWLVDAARERLEAIVRRHEGDPAELAARAWWAEREAAGARLEVGGRP